MILTRFKRTGTTVLGVLKDDDGGTYFTCENANKVIPAGHYAVEVTTSPKFGRKLPLIVGVGVGAERGIRIHYGNSCKDSDGCILVGNDCNLVDCTIGNSSKALEQLLEHCGESLTIFE